VQASTTELGRLFQVLTTRAEKKNTFLNHNETTMWENAQLDGRAAQYRWRPLFNAEKFG